MICADGDAKWALRAVKRRVAAQRGVAAGVQP